MNIFFIAIGGLIIALALVGIHRNDKKKNELYTMLSVIYCLALALGLIFALWGVSQ